MGISFEPLTSRLRVEQRANEQARSKVRVNPARRIDDFIFFVVLARTRWVQLTLSSLSPLFKAVMSINLSIIKRNILVSAKTQTRGCWVRSKDATPVDDFIYQI